MRYRGQQKGSMVAQISHYQGKNNQALGLFTSQERGFWHRVVAIYMGVLPDLERDLQRAGKISFFEFQVLDHLASQHGSMTMSQLAARCSSSLSRLSHVARKLEGRKLLTRRLSEADKRVTVAEITFEGRELIVSLRDIYIIAPWKAICWNRYLQKSCDKLSNYLTTCSDAMNLTTGYFRPEAPCVRTRFWPTTELRNKPCGSLIKPSCRTKL